MRVIAGSLKGVQLRVGHGPFYRPTAQIVKGSIFDSLGDRVVGATFCDLFAGSGAVGIEAVSRGAGKVVFVEQDRRVLRALRTNLERCGVDRSRAEVKIGDVFRFLSRASRRGDFFDIVFADPPYTSNVAQKVLQEFESLKRQLCGLLIIEHGAPIYLSEGSMLEVIGSRKFGQTLITYLSYRKEVSEGEG